jgi:hypothetical protein
MKASDKTKTRGRPKKQGATAIVPPPQDEITVTTPSVSSAGTVLSGIAKLSRVFTLRRAYYAWLILLTIAVMYLLFYPALSELTILSKGLTPYQSKLQLFVQSNPATNQLSPEAKSIMIQALQKLRLSQSSWPNRSSQQLLPSQLRQLLRNNVEELLEGKDKKVISEIKIISDIIADQLNDDYESGQLADDNQSIMQAFFAIEKGLRK